MSYLCLILTHIFSWPSSRRDHTIVRRHLHPKFNRIPRRQICDANKSSSSLLLILLSRLLPLSVASGSVFTSSTLSNHHRRRISRRHRHHHPHLHFRSVSRVETCAIHLKHLKTQASPVFCLRLRLASAAERTQIRRRSQQLPRRLHFPLTSPSRITTTATCY